MGAWAAPWVALAQEAANGGDSAADAAAEGEGNCGVAA